jgi:pimeloyl-ACP methyl ester carboxylesterase
MGRGSRESKKMRRTVLLLILGTLGLVASSTSGARVGADDPCLQPGETPVQMKTSDGVTVYGVEVGAGTTGIVLAHQYFSDHCEFMDFARELAQLGYRTISIDFRCNGLSSCGNVMRMDRDVAAAAARLRSEGATRVELVGASMGGTAVLVGAARIRPVVHGVVSLSGPSYFRGLSAGLAVKRSRVPLRLLVSKGDRRFARDASFLMKVAIAKDKAILRLPGTAHGSTILQAPVAKAFVLDFLAR